MAHVEPHRALILALSAQAAITAIYGDRIYGGSSYAAGYGLDAGPALRVAVRGGVPDVEFPILRPVSFMIESTGEDEATAAAHLGAIWDVLIRLRSGTILICNPETEVQTIIDERTTWPVAFSFWEVTIRNTNEVAP